MINSICHQCDSVAGCQSREKICPNLVIAQPKQPAAAKLLQIIAATYQIAGACDVPTRILDVLANPERATKGQIDAMLPFVQPATKKNFCPRCGKRSGEVDDVHTCTPPVSKANP